MILITGGTGYIGSHTALELLLSGEDIVVFDNLSNSSESIIKSLEELSGRKILFVQGDIRVKLDLSSLFKKYKITAVIHFAGLKAVGESMSNPLTYYNTNVSGTINLLEVMDENNCKKIIFSSSATVYGNSLNGTSLKENDKTNPENPYGRSKLIVEKILKDLADSDREWKIIALRYFNPIGSHVSGTLNESPKGVSQNIMPTLLKVAEGELETLLIFGNTYPTEDGTGVRDYIHVTDLARGHIKALSLLDSIDTMELINLGSGVGYSVLEIIKVFESVSNKKISYRVVEKREGDVAIYLADPSYAKKILNWSAELGIERMCQDVWAGRKPASD